MVVVGDFRVVAGEQPGTAQLPALTLAAVVLTQSPIESSLAIADAAGVVEDQYPTLYYYPVTTL